MAVKKSRDEISLVTVDFAGLAPTHKITQQGFGDFGIRVRCERLTQHCRRDSHVQQMQPAIHAGESFRKILLRVAERDFIEPARNGYIAAERVSQKLLVKTLDCRQDSQFKLKVLCQEAAPRTRFSSSIGGILNFCPSKDESYQRSKLPAEQYYLASFPVSGGAWTS